MKHLFLLSTALFCFSLAACSPARTVVAPVIDSPVTAQTNPDTTAGSDASTSPNRPVAPRNDDDTPLPIDREVDTGTLSNGLRYYIRANSKPERRAELHLVVHAGSILEEDNQRGLAHFVEHMAFNGTEKFEKQALVDYLESIGTRFGPDLNAYTSFDETVYMLEVRTDSLDQFDTGIDVLREWASRIRFDEEEIDKERGVVIEEWRLGRGAFARVRDKEFPVLLQGSRYADRLPIGSVDVLESASYETIRAFYQDWYRPDLMAVVAVGDFDAEQMESMIRERFGDLQRPEDPTPRPTFDVPGHTETLVSVEDDPELPYSTVRVVYKHDKQPEGTVGAYRRSLVESLYSIMFNDRLDELTQSIDPPFTAAFAGPGSFVRGSDFYNLTAIAGPQGLLRATDVLLTEAERVQRHGFTLPELNRAKTNLVRSYEKAYAERDKSESSRFAAEYIRHFLVDEPIPGIAYEYDLVKQLLPSIPLEEVNRLVTSYITPDNRVLLASGPVGEADAPLPPASDFLAVFDSVGARPIEAYRETVSEAPLLPNLPDPAAVVEVSHEEAIDVTRIRLENGVRVVMKPTAFKNDEVVFSAYSPGGTSLYPDSLYVPASYASTLIGQSGVGSFGPIELGKKLAGIVARVGPSIGSRSEGFSGSASPEDLETLFQLIHLYVTEPRADSVAYASFKQRIGQFMLSRKGDPATAFGDTISVTMAQDHPRAQPFSEATLAAMDLDKSLEIYRDRFSDAGDFTFYFVGNFDVDSLSALAATYLGTLPATGREEDGQDIGIRPPKGPLSKVVYKGVEPKSQVRIIRTGPASWSMDERRLLSSLSDVIEIKLREVLREDLGATYGVSVGGSISREPVEQYRLSISFGCDPSRVDELIATVNSQIDSLKAFGLPDTYLGKVREAMLRSHTVNLERNGYWLSTLGFFDRNDLDPTDIPDGLPRYMESLTSDMIHEAANRYFATEHIATFVLRPQEGQ